MKKVILIFALALGLTAQAQTGLTIGASRASSNDAEQYAGMATFGLDFGPGSLIIEPEIGILYGGSDATVFTVGAKGGINFDKSLSLYGKAVVLTDNVAGAVETLADQQSINGVEEVDGLVYGIGITIEGKKNSAFTIEYLRNANGGLINAGLRLNFRSSDKNAE